MSNQLKIIITAILFYFIFNLNLAEASSTYSIVKANKIGENYACLIKEEITDFENFSPYFLCRIIILQDVKLHKNDKYFYNDYPHNHANKDFILRTFKSCVITLNSLNIKHK